MPSAVQAIARISNKVTASIIHAKASCGYRTFGYSFAILSGDHPCGGDKLAPTALLKRRM